MLQEALLRTLIEFADTLVDDYEVTEFVDRLCRRCVDLFGVDAAGVLLLRGNGHLGVAGASDPVAGGVELIQQELEEGPCVEAHAQGREVLVDDLAAHGRWPRFSELAERMGVGAVYSFPLQVREERIGALNLFRGEPGPLSPEDAAGVRALAALATVGIVHARTVHDHAQLTGQLQVALDSRVLIEQAKGVVAASNSLDMTHAFDLLRGHARNRGRKLREVAQQVVDGTLVLPDPQADHLEPR